MLARMAKVSFCGLLLTSVCATGRADDWKGRTAEASSPTVLRSGGAVQEHLEVPTDEAAEFERLDRLFGTQPETPIEIFEEASSGLSVPMGQSSPDPLNAPAPLPQRQHEAYTPGTVPSLQQVIDGDACTPESMSSMSWNRYYGQRMDQVLSGQGCADEHWLQRWWHGNSEAFRARNQQMIHHIGQTVQTAGASVQSAAVVAQAKVSRYVDEHTLPPQFVPDVDIYDSRPRAIALGAVRTASAGDDQTESRIARLTRDITSIQPTLSYALKGIEADQLPSDFYDKLDNGEYVARRGSPTVMQWAPTNLYHHPLYFEDPALERYGHTYHPLIQPFASTGRFATQLVGLPYQMTLHPVHAHEYTLGWYRPGDFAPKKFYQIPFNEEAALMQAATIAGLILIFP